MNPKSTLNQAAALSVVGAIVGGSLGSASLLKAAHDMGKGVTTITNATITSSMTVTSITFQDHVSGAKYAAPALDHRPASARGEPPSVAPPFVSFKRFELS